MSTRALHPRAVFDRPAAASGGYRWYVLALLMLIYAMNFVDRQIVTILAPYLKTDLALSDAQTGLLWWCARLLLRSEANVVERARAAGEPI